MSITAVMAPVPQGPHVRIGDDRHHLVLVPHAGRQDTLEIHGLAGRGHGILVELAGIVVALDYDPE